MISAQLKQSEGAFGQEDYIERLFLPNSRDLVRLLAYFNMIQFHPQLIHCPFAQALLIEQNTESQAQSSDSRGSSRKLARKI